MDPTSADLAAALRERLAIIADEESRREPEEHTERLRVISKRSSASNNRYRPELIPSSAISSDAAATAKRSIC